MRKTASGLKDVTVWWNSSYFDMMDWMFVYKNNRFFIITDGFWGSNRRFHYCWYTPYIFDNLLQKICIISLTCQTYCKKIVYRCWWMWYATAHVPLFGAVRQHERRIRVPLSRGLQVLQAELHVRRLGDSRRQRLLTAGSAVPAVHVQQGRDELRGAAMQLLAARHRAEQVLPAVRQATGVPPPGAVGRDIDARRAVVVSVSDVRVSVWWDWLLGDELSSVDLW